MPALHLGSEDYATDGINGKVGIGTATPAELLSLASGALLLDNNQSIKMKDPGGTARSVLSFDSGGTVSVGETGYGSDLSLNAGAGNAILKSSGRFGIGVTSPSSWLHVKKDSSSVDLLRLDDTPRTDGKEWAIGPGIEAAGKLTFKNVTDGKTIATLSYFSDQSVQAFQVGGYSLQTSGSNFLGVGQLTTMGTPDTGNHGLLRVTHLATTGTSIGQLSFGFRNNANSGHFTGLRMSTVKVSGQDKANTNFEYYDGSIMTSAIYIKEDGNIGIGTTLPDEKLYVFGSAKASRFLAGGGSASSPGYQFTGDDNSGMFQATSDQLSFCTDGVERLKIGTSIITVVADLNPLGGGSRNSGSATNYWNDISYKTLTDRGCLGLFKKVELLNGDSVSPCEALLSIRAHGKKKTIYGVDMLDYQSFPRVCYKPADMEGNLLPRDENDEPYVIGQNGDKHHAADGVEMTSLFSIMIAAIQELSLKVRHLEGNPITESRTTIPELTGKTA